MKTHTTDKQLEIERLNEDDRFNYRIIWGNPLTGDSDGQIFVNSLNINGYAFSTKYMQIGEYQKSIKIEEHNTSANIVLED